MITTSNDRINAANSAAAIRKIQKVTITLIIFITVSLIALKASCADSTHIISAKNIFYAEVSGRADAKSVNFEHIFRQGRIAFSYSAGFATGTKSISVPVAFHAFTTGSNNHLELALAVIPYVEKHTYAKHDADLDKQMFIKPTIGYRYQKNAGGLFLKAGIGPQIFMDPPSSNFWNFTPQLVKASAYLSVGFSF
jgi:hypothetical protein